MGVAIGWKRQRVAGLPGRDSRPATDPSGRSLGRGPRSTGRLFCLIERRMDMLDAIDRLDWLKHQVDQLWNGAMAAPPAAYPALNLWDDGESFHAEAELPGFRIDDIDLAVAGSELRIRGRRETPDV